MKRLMCKGKIHRAAVTEANLDYVGSITIGEELMKAADIMPYEIVQITNLSNAVRWKTYAVPGGTGRICLNGPPARLFRPGDQVIILSMGLFDEEEIRTLKPKVVFVDEANRIRDIREHALFGESGGIDWSSLRI